jgi:hypothetical protein
VKEIEMMFFGRELNPEELERLKTEREEADRVYNDALTAVDAAIPKRPDFPHPPPGYDEQQVTPLNLGWQILAQPPVGPVAGWQGKLAAFVWRLVEPTFARQQAFNALLVDHVNRNVVVHRATREAITTSLSVGRGQIEALERFHDKLILYLQSVTFYVDTKDHSETMALMVKGLSGGLDGVTDQFLKRAEAMTAREQRLEALVEDARAAVAALRQAHAELAGRLLALQEASTTRPARTGNGQVPPKD